MPLASREVGHSPEVSWFWSGLHASHPERFPFLHLARVMLPAPWKSGVRESAHCSLSDRGVACPGFVLLHSHAGNVIFKFMDMATLGITRTASPALYDCVSDAALELPQRVLFQMLPDVRESDEQSDIGTPLQQQLEEVFDCTLSLCMNLTRARAAVIDSRDWDNMLWQAAALNCKHSVFLALKHGADTEHVGAEGQPPLWAAARFGSCDAVRFLLAYGAAVEGASYDRPVSSPLWIAAHEGHREIVEYLSVVASAEHRFPPGDGPSVREIAEQRGHADVVAVLSTTT